MQRVRVCSSPTSWVERLFATESCDCNFFGNKISNNISETVCMTVPRIQSWHKYVIFVIIFESIVTGYTDSTSNC